MKERKKPHEYRNGTCLTHTSTVSNGSINITFSLQMEAICSIAPYFTTFDIVPYFLQLGGSTFTATHKILYPPSSSFFIFLMTPVISHLFLYTNTTILGLCGLIECRHLSPFFYYIGKSDKFSLNLDGKHSALNTWPHPRSKLYNSSNAAT